MTETPWSIPGNRHWRDTVTIETVGRVTVSTCRPWVTGMSAQRDDYETCLFTQRGGSTVIPIYVDGDAAFVTAS
jgi:hypothetical protein